MTEKKPLLLLLDGNALIHRAFHALPPLTVGRTGEAVGALYGFIRMLLKVIADYQPTHWAIAFDRPTPTFRHLEFPDYKAQRPKIPEELAEQLRRVRELVRALGIPAFEMDGYEADDILGTLSRQASANKIDAIIVTGDADAMQLVSTGIRVLTPERTFGDVMLYDGNAVCQKYGVSPEQIPDLKALEGDSSDNIPGVPGVGEKTAVRLIQQLGGIESIYEHTDEVSPPRLRQLIRENEEMARRGKALTTIVTDVPVTLDLTSCQVGTYDRDEVEKIFREMEFFSLLDKLPRAESGEGGGSGVSVMDGETMLEKAYLAVEDVEALDGLAAQLSSSSSFAIHLETSTGKSAPLQLLGVAISPAPTRAYYIPVCGGGLGLTSGLPLEMVMSRLGPLIGSATIAKIAHDGKGEIRLLAANGIELQNLEFDTMLAAYLLGERSLELRALALSRLEVGVELLSTDAPSRVACAKADIIGRLSKMLRAELEERELRGLFSEVEIPLIPVLVRMERNGVTLNVGMLKDISQELGKQLVGQENEIYKDVGHRFNINSPQQLGTVLFEELELPSARRTKKGYSTDASVLDRLKKVHPVVEHVLEYRQLMKLKSTYVDALPTMIDPSTGRLHTSFNQMTTATGRLSSSEPNLQNIPIRGEWGQKIRRAFIAEPPSLLLGGDYSQVELRILAHLSQDAGLLEAFMHNEDIHTATASEVFNVSPEDVTSDMRRVAKTVNFGVAYGMSDYGLEQATELSREEARHFITSYFERYPGVKDYIESTKHQARERGYVQTLLGRRRYIPEINSPNQQVRAAAERMAINMPVQGTAADIVKLAMIRLHGEIERRGLKSKMILQVHDELLFEVLPDELGEMRNMLGDIMSGAVELDVPLKVDIEIGRNWGEMNHGS